MDLPREVPVMTLPNAILFPGALLPLYIFEPGYRRMLADSLHSHRLFAVAMQKPGCQRKIPAGVAGLGLIRVAVTRPDTTSYLILQGLARVALETTVRRRPYRIEQVRPLTPEASDQPSLKPLTKHLRDLVAQRLDQGLSDAQLSLKQTIPADQATSFDSLAVYSLQHFVKYLNQLDDPGQIADLVSCTLLPQPLRRQEVLETVDLETRLRKVITFLLQEMQKRNKGPE